MDNMGLKIQALRKQHQLSQDDLASKMDVSRQAISKWERGEALPDLYNVKRLATIFQVTIDELLDIEIKHESIQEVPNNKVSLALLTVVGAIMSACVILFFAVGFYVLFAL